MFENVKIERFRKSSLIRVSDGNELIHQGWGEVDSNFADRVYSTIERAGYEPVTEGLKTVFKRKMG